MTTWNPRANDLFLKALELRPAAERREFLVRACAGDAVLRAEVEALLEASDRAGSFLVSPPGSPTRSTAPAAPEEGTGTVIGPYKLLQQIGEGGMGTVYMAEQSRPVRRRVALKVIKPGMDSRQVIARFEAERQALALMDHVHIARVLDAGATESGRPYFVMELVHGVPITQYCDANRLTPRQRLELFVPVCLAIQHAHQKGVIHRDIKPSNVLVTLYDGRPVPKVIDFGVAKATEQSLTERTLFTQYGTLVGTLEYMSPEQAGMSALGVDTRSDVYSLGVLLYELLTGSTPLSHKRVREAAHGEILRMIKEDEPARPSTRLSESGDDLASISAQRHTEPARLTRLLRGELDWIVMKTLEKDRTRRYETASGLAADVRRHLDDEPVQACPPSAGYRLRKLARRNRAILLTAALVAVALMVGAAVSVWQAVRARGAETLALTRLVSESQARRDADLARAEAVAQRELARGNLRKARQAVDDMYTQVAEKWLANQPQMEPVQREFLEKALRFYREFAQQGGGTGPEVRLETARSYRRVADIQFRLGATAQAETAFREAIDRLKALADEFPGVPEYREVLGDTLHKFGKLVGDLDRSSEEEKVHREALALEERLATDFPTDPRYKRDLARGQYWLGIALGELGKPRDAEVAFSAAIALQEKLVDGPSSLPEDREYLAVSLMSRGRRLIRVIIGSERALKDFRRSIDLLERLVDEFPNLPQYRNELADAYFRMSGSFGDLLPLPEAEQTLKKALDIQRKLAADFPRVMYYRYDLVRGLLHLGRLLKASHRTSEAIDALCEAREVGEKLAAETPPTVTYIHNRVGQVYVDLVKLLIDAGRVSEANDLKRRIIESSSAGCLNRQAWALATDPEEKHHDPETALAMARKAVELAPNASNIWNTLGVALYRSGDWKGAIEALEQSERLAPGEYSDINGFFLAMANRRLGEKDTARERYDRAVEWINKNQPMNKDLRRFRAEAAESLGLNEKK